MDEDVLDYVKEKILGAKVEQNPYPYFYIDQIFPKDFYEKLLSHLPDNTSYIGMGQTGKVDPRTYQERSVIPLEPPELNQLPFSDLLFWGPFSSAMNSEEWVSMLKEKFSSAIKDRFQDFYDKVTFSSFSELVRDRSNYAIGPHTDHPVRVITLLFYFPKDNSQAHLGTSVYKPKNSSFTCEGFSHHPFEQFEKVYTAPFTPNSVFGFVRSDNSFHGVEPILDENVDRNLMNYYLKWEFK